MSDMVGIDPLAIEITKEINDANIKAQEKRCVTWEHEELAQVRIRVIRGHTDAVNTCSFCDNDSKVLTASNDKTICLWDLKTGDCAHIYEGHHGYVSGAHTNRDVQRIVSSSWDKTLKFWDIETGRVIWSGTHSGMVTGCDFTSDGKLAVSGTDIDKSVIVWDTSIGQPVLKLPDHHKSTITSCKFTPSNDRVMSTGMDQCTKFYDLRSNTVTITLQGHTNIISDCSMSPDERKLATVSWDKSIQIWDVSTGAYRSQGPTNLEKAHEGSISSCFFSSDGSLLVTGGYDNTVALWDIEDNVQKLRLQGHSGWVEGVQCSTDMKWLLSCSKDNTVRLWNIEESDKIPLVLENRKSMGLKVQKCTTCGKPFSMSQADAQSNSVLCVFCRLNSTSNSFFELEDLPPI